MNKSVLHLNFSLFKQDQQASKENESLSNRPTDITIEAGEDDFFFSRTQQETPVLPEFEALNISIIPREFAFDSILKSSLLEDDLVSENPKNLRPLKIETNQIDSRLLCSGCMGSFSSPCSLF
jgi:hypothetical protein